MHHEQFSAVTCYYFEVMGATYRDNFVSPPRILIVFMCKCLMDLLHLLFHCSHERIIVNIILYTS